MLSSPHTTGSSPLKICVWCSTMVLVTWPLSSDAARLRCGSELLSDLIFVCGDRGIYFGKGSWSGYGARPRGKGIVDKCCRTGGCELHHLETYCAKPKSQKHTTALPSTSTSTSMSTSTSTAQQPTSPQTELAQQVQAVFQRRLAEHLGAPGSPKREAYRKKRLQPPRRQKNRVSSLRRKMNPQLMTSTPPASRTQGNPQKTTSF